MALKLAGGASESAADWLLVVWDAAGSEAFSAACGAADGAGA